MTRDEKDEEEKEKERLFVVYSKYTASKISTAKPSFVCLPAFSAICLRMVAVMAVVAYL